MVKKLVASASIADLAVHRCASGKFQKQKNAVSCCDQVVTCHRVVNESSGLGPNPKI